MKASNILNFSIFLATLTLVSNVTHARGVIDASVIEKITTSGNTAFLINTGTASRAVSGESIPACATNRNSMTLPVTDKANLALLLTASAAGSEVRLVGKGSCNEVGSVESIGFIQTTFK